MLNSILLENAIQKPIINSTDHSITEGTVRIEIQNDHILYDIVDTMSQNIIPTSMKIWIYKTFLHFNNQRWPLHEFYESQKLLGGAKQLEFTYNGQILLLPDEIKDGILKLLKEGYDGFDCHAFQNIATKQLEFGSSEKISFDYPLVSARPWSGSKDWVNSIPSDQTILNSAHPGAYFYFTGGHSAIEIGPNLILSKLGSAGLTVAPVQSLAFNYGGDLRVSKIKSFISLSDKTRINVTPEFEGTKLESFLKSLRKHFYYIKATDEYERDNAIISFTAPGYVSYKIDYIKLKTPGYSMSAGERFKFWLLENIRKTDNVEDFIKTNLNELKKYIRIVPTENFWFRTSFDG